jgi:hypothetical protein
MRLHGQRRSDLFSLHFSGLCIAGIALTAIGGLFLVFSLLYLIAVCCSSNRVRRQPTNIIWSDYDPSLRRTNQVQPAQQSTVVIINNQPAAYQGQPTYSQQPPNYQAAIDAAYPPPPPVRY